MQLSLSIRVRACVFVCVQASVNQTDQELFETNDSWCVVWTSSTAPVDMKPLFEDDRRYSGSAPLHGPPMPPSILSPSLSLRMQRLRVFICPLSNWKGIAILLKYHFHPFHQQRSVNTLKWPLRPSELRSSIHSLSGVKSLLNCSLWRGLFQRGSSFCRLGSFQNAIQNDVYYLWSTEYSRVFGSYYNNLGG